MTYSIPPKKKLGKHKAYDIDYLVRCHQRDEFRDCDWASRIVMGLPLPAWQRPFEWDIVQQERFIQSLYTDRYHGVYVVNATDYVDNSGAPRKFSSALLDGQQRITTVENYLNDAFKVFGVYWSQLTKKDQRRFLKTDFHCIEVDIWDESELRQLSDDLAFSGTAHKDEYRATLGYTYKPD